MTEAEKAMQRSNQTASFMAEIATVKRKLATAVERITEKQQQYRWLYGGESERDKSLLNGRFDGLQMALDILDAIQGDAEREAGK